MTTKAELLKAVRKHCLDCCCGYASEVKNCAVGIKCRLFPYRKGADPTPSNSRGFKKSTCSR